MKSLVARWGCGISSKWFDADETEAQNQLYLKSAEDYAAKQDAETWDYKNLRREMGCAVDELVRAVEPVEIEIEVAVEKPRETALAKDVQPVEAQNNFYERSLSRGWTG